MLLLDTNVVSELRRERKHNKDVLGYLSREEQAGRAAYLAAPTVGELERGVALLRYRGEDDAATQLNDWFSGILEAFADRILPFDTACAHAWGQLLVPRYTQIVDKQIAATAIVYGLSLVTRNTRDFEGYGLTLINPFTKTH